MKLSEIKKAVLAGQEVCWKSTAYDVKYFPDYNEWFVVCNINQSFSGLTYLDREVLVDSEEDFFIK